VERPAVIAHVEALLRQPRVDDDRSADALLAQVRARMFGVAPSEPRLGRYRVLGALGAGGAGVVLRGHDPQLGRDVAIKLVHRGGRGGDDAAQLRLLREARAIARLSHPNVVAVYDVGRFDGATLGGVSVGGGGVYVVMELVEGEDLAQWSTRPHGVAEILEMYRAAGRGLAAAHAHGLLHRDFKPHNVLVGADGRVRVADFGLTRAHGERRDDVDIVRDDALSLTGAGTVVGTPLYMAPEQHIGGVLDERSDQYAFCFALREAIWGRPRITDLDALVAFKHQPSTLPARRGITRSVRLAIERGLQPDPDARWPSMVALLAALGPRRSRTMLRWGVVGAAALVAGFALLRPTAHASDGPCAPEDPGWSRVWGPQVRDEIGAAFDRGAPAVAAVAITGVDAHMTALGGRWSVVRDDVCVVARDRAAIECLAHRRSAAAALVQQWRAGGIAATNRAIEAAAALPSPTDCARPMASESRAKDADIVEIDALSAGGRIAEAATRAAALEPRLAAMSGSAAAWSGLSAGAALDAGGDFVAAERVLARAFDHAQIVDDHEAAVRIAALLVSVIGPHAGRTDDADLWARHAWAALARADDPPLLRAEVVRHLGHLAAARGLWDRALEHYEADAALRREASGAASLAHGRALENVANARVHLGDHELAIEHYRRLLELRAEVLGDAHPDVAITRHNLAAALLQRGDVVEAEAECRTALGLWRASYGERHPDVALARYSLGSILVTAGRPDEAVTELRAAVSLRRDLLGDEHSDTLATMTNLANALDAVGRPDEALAVLEPVVRIHDRPGNDRPDRGVVLLNYGNLLRASGELERARQIHVRTIAEFTNERGARHWATAIGWFTLATDDRLLGAFDRAESEIDTAIAILTEALPADHVRWIGVLQEQGRIALTRDRLALARDALTRALALRAAHPDADESTAELRADLDEVERRLHGVDR
jgi:tetratricopeptide (TPR) repeat protein